MPDSPIEPAVQKLRAFCQELAVRRGLSEAVRTELCAHLEDKLGGYLTGKIPLTEDDALVLVRAHFGDAEQIAGSLRKLTTGTEPSAARRVLLRRFATVTGVLTTLSILPAAAAPARIYWLSDPGPFLAIVLAAVVMFAGPALFAARVDLSNWKQRLVGAWFLALVGTQLLPAICGAGLWSAAFRPSSLNVAAAIAATLGQTVLFALLLVPLRAKTPDVFAAGCC